MLGDVDFRPEDVRTKATNSRIICWPGASLQLADRSRGYIRGNIKERYDMGMLNMSPLDWVTRVMDFSQTSLENTLNTVKEVHQTVAEIPINIAQEFGMPDETATALKDTHRRVLDHINNGVRDSVGIVNQYMVKQAQNVDRLANFDRLPSAPTIVQLESKKAQQEEIKLN
jgi:hypothetical protein